MGSKPGAFIFLRLLYIALGIVFLNVACGTSARYRFVQASTGAPGVNVDVQLDGKTVLTNVGYGTVSSYESAPSGSSSIKVFSAGTGTNAYYDGTVSLGSGDTTLISENNFSAMQLVSYSDDYSTPTLGNMSLRFIHASPLAGSVDVYVITPGSGIAGINPKLTISYGKASGYLSFPGGRYEIDITQVGTQHLLSQSTNTFIAGQVRTLLLLDASDGGSPYTQLILSDLN